MKSHRKFAVQFKRLRVRAKEQFRTVKPLVEWSSQLPGIPKRWLEQSFPPARQQELAAFFKVLLKCPRHVGAIFPSSVYLAQEMANKAASDTTGYVVELGPGTGVITHALLESGIAPERLIAVEFSNELAEHLQKRFSNIKVIQGDAANLSDLLGVYSNKVSTIVSGLPLRSLPTVMTEQILQQVAAVLVKGGRFIQFTYGYRVLNEIFPAHFYRIYSKWIWRNLPPARVDIYFVSPQSE